MPDDYKSSLGLLSLSKNDIQKKKNPKSLTQPEQHWSQCVHGNSTGQGRLEGLTHHGVGQMTHAFENTLSMVMLIWPRLDFNFKNDFINIFNQNTFVRRVRARF